eukprot:TRINITY_DN58790_c0_g1_i1.p1 TRINITY_DN58790_c0_g1~~TRINITY_DN58790_c0_g1_i1.p1  ORF type:complete len:124 (-),score=18.98 TRINITY_DN58790_c0_g1_i1:75-446(-)
MTVHVAASSILAAPQRPQDATQRAVKSPRPPRPSASGTSLTRAGPLGHAGLVAAGLAEAPAASSGLATGKAEAAGPRPSAVGRLAASHVLGQGAPSTSTPAPAPSGISPSAEAAVEATAEWLA